MGRLLDVRMRAGEGGKTVVAVECNTCKAGVVCGKVQTHKKRRGINGGPVEQACYSTLQHPIPKLTSRCLLCCVPGLKLRTGRCRRWQHGAGR